MLVRPIFSNSKEHPRLWPKVANSSSPTRQHQEHAAPQSCELMGPAFDARSRGPTGEFDVRVESFPLPG